MKDLIRTSDLSPADIKYLLARAQKFKQNPHARRSLLTGECVCLYFAKPSTRTLQRFAEATGHRLKISFEPVKGKARRRSASS